MSTDSQTVVYALTVLFVSGGILLWMHLTLPLWVLAVVDSALSAGVAYTWHQEVTSGRSVTQMTTLVAVVVLWVLASAWVWPKVVRTMGFLYRVLRGMCITLGNKAEGFANIDRKES